MRDLPCTPVDLSGIGMSQARSGRSPRLTFDVFCTNQPEQQGHRGPPLDLTQRYISRNNRFEVELATGNRRSLYIRGLKRNSGWCRNRATRCRGPRNQSRYACECLSRLHALGWQVLPDMTLRWQGDHSKPRTFLGLPNHVGCAGTSGKASGHPRRKSDRNETFRGPDIHPLRQR